jgi:hypothetical protein
VAKDKDKEPAKDEPRAEAAVPAPARSGPRYQVRTPASGFRGERHGIRFVDGVGETDDADAVAACLACGYVVVDREKDKTFGPSPRFTLKAAEANFGGSVLGVRFTEGLAKTDDPAVARAFRDLGYAVRDADEGGKGKRMSWPLATGH